MTTAKFILQAPRPVFKVHPPITKVGQCLQSSSFFLWGKAKSSKSNLPVERWETIHMWCVFFYTTHCVTKSLESTYPTISSMMLHYCALQWLSQCWRHPCPQQSLTPSLLPSTLSAYFWPVFFTSSLIKAQAKEWSSRHAALFRFSSFQWSVPLSLVTSTTVLSRLTVTQPLHHPSIFDMWYV